MPAAPLVTRATVLYLFATEWLPRRPGEETILVPGGKTTALDTGANLLHAALWNLQRQGVLEIEQLRPVEKERRIVLGGRSFTRFEMRLPEARLRGLEGALLDASREQAEPDGWLATKAREFAGEDEHGLRDLILSMKKLKGRSCATVVGYCLGEAAAAGLVRVSGRIVRKVEIADAGAVASQKPYFEAVRAERKETMDADPQLHQAIVADCVTALEWAGVKPSNIS